jgi:uncharacterized membrane protein YbhN (UPF0104 family)
MQSKISKLLKVGGKLLFILFAFYLLSYKLRFEEVYKIISGASLGFLIIALIFSHLSLLASAYRSRYYFSRYGCDVKPGFAIKLYYIGTFYNILLPGGIGGDGYKVYLIGKLKSFSRIKSLRIMLYERVNGFYALCVLGFLLNFISDFVAVIPYLFELNLSLLFLVTPCYLFGIKYVLKDEVETASIAALYSFVVQILQLVMFIAILYALKVNLVTVEIINLSVLFVIASIVAIIPISIGGVGLRELTFLYGTTFINNADQSIAVAAAMIVFIIYIITALPGAFFSLNAKAD